MEQINYNLLFRWFVGLGIDDAVWDHSTFSKNRERLLGADVAAKFLAAVLRHPKVTRFLSDEHFSVDGTLVEAWASLKSFRAKDGSDEPPAPGRNGERRFPQREAQQRDACLDHGPGCQALSQRQQPGGQAQLHGTCSDGEPAWARRRCDAHTRHRNGGAGSGHQDDRPALAGSPTPDPGADKGYDTKNFVADLRELNIAPHVAQNTTNRASAIDGRTTRHPGYAVSQIIRKRIEESFAWTKTIAGLHKTKHRGVGRVAFQFVFAMAAYNLIRMPRLLSTAA